MQVLRLPLAGSLILLVLASLGECCFKEIAQALKPVKHTTKMENKGCFAKEQMEGSGARQTVLGVRLSTASCGAHCKNMGKSGVMGLGRGHCWCGYHGEGNPVANHFCDVDCPGNSRESCGSSNFVSVYTIL